MTISCRGEGEERMEWEKGGGEGRGGKGKGKEEKGKRLTWQTSVSEMEIQNSQASSATSD